MRAESLNPVDGVPIAWESVGDEHAEAVLFVHGSALSKAIWRGMGYVKALAPKYRVITMDMRGHGRSGKPHDPRSYRMETVVSDVLAVLDAAQVAQTHYVGYSFGARAGFALGVTAPERMRSFVSLAGSYRISEGSIAQLFFADYDQALANGGMDAFIAGWEAQIGHRVDPVTRLAFRQNDPLALRAYFAQTEAGEAVSEAQLHAFKAPTLLMAGSLDSSRLADSRLAAQLMPQASLVELPGRDHGDTLVPAAEVLAAVVPFIGSHSLTQLAQPPTL